MTNDSDSGSAHTQPARGAMLLMLAQIVILASGFGVSIILGRGLGPIDFGVYGTVLAVLTVFERTLAAGIPIAAATMIARHDRRQLELEQAALVLMVGWALILWAALELGALALSRYLNVDTTLLRVLALNIPAMGVYLAYDAIFSGRRAFGMQSSLQTLQSVVKLAGVLILLFWGLSVLGAFVAHVVASMAAVAIALLRFPPRFKWPARDLVISMSRIALTSGFYTIALSMLMSLSLWQLGASGTQVAMTVGFFVASQNITRLLLVVPIALSGVLFTSASWASGRSETELFKKYIGETVRLAVILLLPACTLVWIDAEGVIRLLYGDKYAGAGAVLGMLCIAYAAMGLLDILAHVLMADGRFKSAAVLACALVPLLFTLNRALIPAAAGIGAGAAMAVVFLLGIAVSGVQIYRKWGGFLRWHTMWRVTAVCSGMALISRQIHAQSAWLIVKLGALGLLYLLALWMLGEITVADLSAFKKTKTRPA